MLYFLIKCRKNKGFSQSKLAYCCGVSRNTISNIERGLYIPNVLLAIKICNALNIPLDIIDILFTFRG